MNRCKDCEHFKNDCGFSEVDEQLKLNGNFVACGQFKHKLNTGGSQIESTSYVECWYCGKKLPLNSQAVIRKGFVGYYCSWKCAAINSMFFKTTLVDEREAKEDKIEIYEQE